MLTSLLLKVVIDRILPGLFLVLLTGQISQAGLDTGTRGVEIVLKEPEIILRSLYDKSWAIVIGVNQYPNDDRNTDFELCRLRCQARGREVGRTGGLKSLHSSTSSRLGKVAFNSWPVIRSKNKVKRPDLVLLCWAWRDK